MGRETRRIGGLLVVAHDGGGSDVEGWHVRGHVVGRVALYLALSAVGVAFPIFMGKQLLGTNPSEWSFPAARILVVGCLGVIAAGLAVVLGMSLVDAVQRLRRPLAFRTSREALLLDGVDHARRTVERFVVQTEPHEDSSTWRVDAVLEDGKPASLITGLDHEADALWLHRVLDRWLVEARGAAGTRGG